MRSVQSKTPRPGASTSVCGAEHLEQRRFLSLVINATFESSVTSLPNAAQVEDIFNYAAQQYETLFSAQITVNIDVSNRSSTGLPGGGSAYSSQGAYTYAQIVSALASHLTTAEDATAIASLGASDPTNGGVFDLPFAEAKALGLRPADDPANDGNVIFTGSDWTFDPTQRGIGGHFDYIGLAEHEISEVLGRAPGFGAPDFLPFDLFRYASHGVRNLTPNGTAYFSIDGGETNLMSFNSSGVGDPQDWGATSPYTPDSYNALSQPGLNDITLTDLIAMNVLGYAPLMAKLAISQAPTSAIAGNVISPAITVLGETANGNTITTENAVVTATIASGPVGATLGGTVSVEASNGVATFTNLSLDEAGTYTLKFTEGSLFNVTSSPFSIIPLPATRLAIVQQPTGTITGAAISPAITVDVEDSNGGTVATDTSTVVATIATGPAGATLGGLTSAQVVNGVATFNNLTLDTPGSYTLSFSDGSLTGVSSSDFGIVNQLREYPLSISFGSFNLASAVVAGATLNSTVPLIITGDGSAFDGQVTFNLYADTGIALDGRQVLVTSKATRIRLKSGANHVFALRIGNIPSALADGTYHLLADATGPWGSTNVAATTQSIQVARAFIRPVASIEEANASNISPGKSGSILLAVTNEGNVPAKGVDVTLGLSQDGLALMPGFTLQSLQSRDIIPPGKSKTFRLHFKAASNLPAGQYLPYVTVVMGGVQTTAVGASPMTFDSPRRLRTA